MLRLLRKLFPFIFGREPGEPPIVILPKKVRPVSEPVVTSPKPPAPKEKPSPKPEPTQTPESPAVTPPKETTPPESKGSGESEGVVGTPQDEADIQVDVAEGSTRIDVKRSSGAKDTLGKLYVDGKFSCYTLELPTSGDTADHAIPAGTYEIGLRKEGGKQATYWHRFQDIHQGMLHIQGAPNHEFAYLSIGFAVEESLGSVLVGQQSQTKGEAHTLLNSDEAYLALYKQLLSAIEAGKKVSIHLS